MSGVQLVPGRVDGVGSDIGGISQCRKKRPEQSPGQETLA